MFWEGAYVWIFFKKPVSAVLARNFGFLLLDKGSASINLKAFHYYYYPEIRGTTDRDIGVLFFEYDGHAGIAKFSTIESKTANKKD
jgi:hypothetical protein